MDINITHLNPADPWATEATAALRNHAPQLVWLCGGDAEGGWAVYGQVQQNHPGLFAVRHDPADPEGLRWHVGYTHDDFGSLGVTRLGDLPQVTRFIRRVVEDPARAFAEGPVA